jgi:hypothetical protein
VAIDLFIDFRQFNSFIPLGMVALIEYDISIAITRRRLKEIPDVKGLIAFLHDELNCW